MKNVIRAYQELINPLWIRSLIKTDERLKQWLNSESVSDLENILEVFENEGMFDDCSIILSILQQKINKLTIEKLIT